MSSELVITNEQFDLIKRTICKGASDDELQLFLHQCKRTSLDPLSRQIHAIKRWDGSAGREIMQVQVGIDGFRIIAERTEETDGQEGPFWCGEDGVWKDAWLSDKAPAAAMVRVFRKGRSKPYTGFARYGAYVQRKKDGGPNVFWSRMPDVMLAKAAEALALRKAFPNDLSGLYIPEELDADHHGEMQKAETNGGTHQKPPAVTTPPATPNPSATISREQAAYLNTLVGGDNGVGWPWLLKRFNVERAGQLTTKQFDEIVSGMNKLLAECAAEHTPPEPETQPDEAEAEFAGV